MLIPVLPPARCEFMNNTRSNAALSQKAEVDIHTLTADQARYHLEQYLNSLGPEIREVSVIHGYSRGTALRDMVRKRLKHPRIKSWVATLNPGETILVLK